MDDKQLQSLQEQLAKDKQNRLASGFDPYAKPLFAQFGGLTGSISENIEPMSFEKTWDEQAQFDKEYLGLRTLKAFDDLKFDVVDDTGSSFNRGRSAVQYGTQMSSMGWGERNPLAERYRMNIAKAKADDFILPSGEIGKLDDTLKGASNWFGGLKEGFEKWFRETETEKGYKALRERLEEVDPAWDAVKKYESLDNWRKNNSEAFDFIERAGINISNYVEPSRNEAGFNVAVYEAAKDAIVAHRMRLWNDSSRYIAKTYAEVVEGFKDPLLARDIITTTVLTAGLAAPQLIGARVGGTAMQAAARTSAGLLNFTGPMTGFVEGLVYPTLQASVLRGAGRSGLQTFTARALSMFAEGTTQGVLSALESQRDEYEWRNLLFHDADKLEKYDFGDTLKIGLTTGAASAAFLGAMRFGLGALGEWKYYRKGDWKNLGRSWANSLDNWAQTKEGLTVFGETLSDGRGILLGNKLDKYMARHDGRNFTNVMLNGSRLFGKMDPTIAAKINLDTKEAIKVIDAFEEATGIAGEAAMRGVDGVDAETKGLFLASLDQDYLKKLGLNYDDVTTVFKEFKNAKDKNLIGPLERSAVSRGLENVASVRKLNDTRTMFRMVEVKAIDKNLAEAGIKSADVLELAEDALEKSVNLLDAQDWSNFRLAAVFAADAALEDNLASRLSSIFSKDETILADGKPIPREVVAPLFRQALKIEEGRKDFIYLTNGGEDNKATFVLMIDPETGEVLKTKRKLVRDDKGNLNVEFEASKNPSYKPENIRSVKEFNEGLHSAIEKANEFFKEEKKSKTRKKIDGVKDPEKKEALEKTFEEMFNEGLDPTIDNIRKIFGKDKMSVSQATVANIIMRSLGYDPEDRLIKIANGSVAETASGNIVLLGTNAIINATKASDLGTLTHEMSHYVRHIFGNETDFAKEARTALGIDESLWSKFKDWCGVEGDNWTVAAEEKFARGFAFYIKSIMEGKGKAPVTSVQRLFHILGDHIGDIGQKFKSEGELGFEMTPVAEEVFEKLFLRSNDNISELFDVAYHKIFRNLPKERREEIGAAVLGEMAWNDYKAKTQKSIAERRMKTDPVIAGSSIPRESTAAVVDRISASVSGSASKKLIKAAIKAGLPMDKVVEYINNTLTMFAEKAYTQVGLGPTDKVLKTSKIDEVPTDVLEKLVFDEKNTAYVATDIEFVFADGTIKPVVSVTSITKNQADRELRNRRLRGTKPPISVPDKVAEMTDAVSEVTTKTGFVDKDGVSVDLSPTEAVVATVKNIEAKETEVAAARTELIADKLETMTLDKVDDVAATTEEAKDAQLKEIKEKNPELAKELDSEDVNVEFTARPTQVSVTVTRLKRVSDSSSRVVQEIASDKDKEQLTIVAETLIASPSRYDELVSIWENYGKNIALPRPLREYLLAEVKKIIARDTLDRMIGLSDLELERFVDIKEKIDLLDSELGSKELEAFTREPNAETTKALSLVSGISEEDLQLYSRGNFHLVNQLHVVEFRIASEFVKTHKDSYDNKVEFLKNNKAAYENANIKETKTPEEQELIEKYNGIKATVSRYDNSVKRVSMGLLGEEVISVGSLKAIETGMIFDISKGDTYKRIIEIFVGKDYEIGIDDLIAEFSKSPSTVESIGKKLGLSPEESLGGFKAWAAGENEYNNTPFTADALTVTRKYVRGIIRTLSDKTKTGERTHKGVIGLYVKSSSGDESAVDVAINRRKSKTNEHIEINNESQIMQFTASVFYDELVRSGETKLAEYFAARRATYWLPGDRLENLVDSYNKRGVDGSELTKSKIDTLEKNLKKKIDEFATRLRLSGLNDAATTVTDAQFNLSMVKPVILNQSSTQAAINSLSDLIEKSFVSFDRPVKVDRSIIREIEINRIKNDLSEDLYKLNDRIMDGRVRDAKQLLEEVAAYNNAYTDIAKKLLENKNTRELLKNVTVMPSVRWSRGAFHPSLNMITLNPFFTIDERLIIHETIHATTMNWISEDIWKYSQHRKTDLYWKTGTEYINTLRQIAEQGGDKITPTTKTLINLYLKAFDSMGLSDSLKELVNNSDAYLLDTEMTTTLYGLFNLEEFLTESISKPEFINMLMQIEGDKTNLISQLLEPVFVSTGLEKTPETVKLASGSILNNILEHTLAISQSDLTRKFSKSQKDILSLIGDYTKKQEFRIDRSTGYLSSLASFKHMGIDPKSKPLIFNQSLIDPAVKEELKLRRDLKASKGRLFEQYKVINQDPFKITLKPELFDISGGQKGSNKAVQVKNKETGKELYIKEGGSALRVVNEILADVFYNHLSHGKTSFIHDKNIFGLNGPLYVSEMIKSDSYEEILDFDKTNQSHIEAVKKLFAYSAWLANWDVVGLSYDNIKIRRQIKNNQFSAIVIDSGGSLMYRAQGQPKGDKFGTVVGEIDTLRDINMNPTAHFVFKNLTFEDIKQQVLELPSDAFINLAVNKLTANIKEITEKDKKFLIDTLIARREYLKDKYLGSQIKIQDNFVEDLYKELQKNIDEQEPELTEAKLDEVRADIINNFRTAMFEKLESIVDDLDKPIEALDLEVQSKVVKLLEAYLIKTHQEFQKVVTNGDYIPAAADLFGFNKASIFYEDAVGLQKGTPVGLLLLANFQDITEKETLAMQNKYLSKTETKKKETTKSNKVKKDASNLLSSITTLQSNVLTVAHSNIKHIDKFSKIASLVDEFTATSLKDVPLDELTSFKKTVESLYSSFALLEEAAGSRSEQELYEGFVDIFITPLKETLNTSSTVDFIRLYRERWPTITETALYDLRRLLSNLGIKEWFEAREVIQKALEGKKLSEFLRVQAFNIIAEIKREKFPEGFIDAGKKERAVKFKDFFIKDGENIIVKNDFDIPILFHRGVHTFMAQDLLEGRAGYAFWGEDLSVARDYGDRGPIPTAYAAIPKEKILYIKPSRETRWDRIDVKDVEKSLIDFGYSEAETEFLLIGLTSEIYEGKTSTDRIAEIFLTTPKAEGKEVFAVCFTNMLDMTTKGDERVPHNQWAIRTDRNIMKSPEAIRFDKSDGPMMILDQKRAEKALSDRIEKAKALGEDTKKLEKELSELVDSAAVRRRNLLEKGFSEEMEPEDIDIIKSMIEGKMPLSGTTGDLMMSRYGSPSTAVSVAAAAAKFKGKAYRDLDKKERMEFVLDVLMPKISEVMGKRNTSAGVFSAASDSVVGKKVNSLIGGGAAYGDTADSSSMGLQFLSKILDPTMDLRDGEIGGVFELFSVDKLNAELNNSYSRSGLLAVKNKMLSRLSSEEDIRSVVHTAWNLLAEPEDSLKTKLESVNNKDLVLDLIKATNKFNEYRADLMMKYGNLKMVDPSKYGTRHRVNNLAFSDQQGFVKALTDNAINKTLDNGELSVITAEALGWLKIRRETGATDSIVSIEVVKDSPIKLKPGFYDWNGETRKLFGKTETDKDGNKITAISRLLDSSDIDKHNKALYSNEDYIPAFKRLYESRGTEYTAIRQSMTIAKDRYLGIVDGDTKTGKPRSESIGRGMDYNEERILSHAEITANPELSKYFRKNIFDLIHDDLRGQLTDLLMKKYISDFFGVKMSWSDLVEILKDYGEESQDKANMSMSEIESRRRGYDRMHDIWEQNIGYSIRTKDSLDRHYNRLITDSRIPVLLFGGIRAAASSLPEIGRAIIASNHNKNKLVQVVPNFIKMLTLFSKNKRDTIKEVASATHWLRGLSSDHLLARSEVSPENPFGGTMLGSRKGGFFKRFAEDWREVSDLNKTESSIVGKTLNRASLFATRLGTPLAWVNDVTTTLHVWNAQTNLTKNSSKFLQLADKLSKKKPTNLGDFAVLAKECGLTAKEAVDLSSAGLLNPSKIKVMIEAAKDQKNYTDGLLDVQKLFIWAGDDQVKIDAINAMGAYINTTSRQTNTEPTLLDLRINQSAFAKSMAVFMQFLLSHSVQEIGRRRRYSTADYGKHLAGLVIMEAVTYSLARQKPDEDKWIWEEARENPIDTIIRISTGMPMLGSYQMWGPVLRMILKGGTNLLTGEDENERLRLPDLYQAPAENLPNKGLEILKSAFEVAF